MTFIHTLATATPPHEMSQADALRLAQAVLRPEEDRSRSLRAIYRRAGVERRHTCVPHERGYAWRDLPPAQAADGQLRSRGAGTRQRMEVYEQHAPPLALAAARQAMERTAVTPRRITHLVTASCTGFVAPGVDHHLITQLGLPATVERVNVGFMGCHAAINALRTSHALAQLSPVARVLMCCVELCSLHYFFGDEPEKLVGNALFADGAAALVAGADRTDSSRCRLRAVGSMLLPDSADAMGWVVGDHGFEMSLSASVPDRIARGLRAWLADWLACSELPLDAVAGWAIHPGGPRIVAAVAEALDLPADATEASRDVLANYGNMSSPTVLFVLKELLCRGVTGPVVMLAFGPGLIAEAALVQLS